MRDRFELARPPASASQAPESCNSQSSSRAPRGPVAAPGHRQSRAAAAAARLNVKAGLAAREARDPSFAKLETPAAPCAYALAQFCTPSPPPCIRRRPSPSISACELLVPAMTGSSQPISRSALCEANAAAAEILVPRRKQERSREAIGLLTLVTSNTEADRCRIATRKK